MSIDLDPSTPFAGRYRVVRRIAQGGMGAVFEVIHLETQRRRALKVMLPELVANPELRSRFQNEARVTAVVDSEYIVDVFDAGVDGPSGMPFLVMELLQGAELSEFIQRQGPVAPQDALTYLRQIASALDRTHAAGIVHRDLKPENLFLSQREDGTPRIKILDFGISKVVRDAHTGSAATRSLGTPLYMAPEQVLGEAVSPATDLYALGLIAFTLLVGSSYWQRDTQSYDNAVAFALHTVKGAKDSAVARASELGRTLPPAFDAWFRRATHLNPAERFRSASELVNELANVLSAPDAAKPSADPATAPAYRASPAVSAPVPSWSAPVGTAPGTEFDRQGTLPRPPAARRQRWFLLAGSALAALIVAVLVQRALSSQPIANPVVGSAGPVPSAPQSAAAVAPPSVGAASVELGAPPARPAATVTAPEIASAPTVERPVAPTASAQPSARVTKPPAVISRPNLKLPQHKPGSTGNDLSPAYTRD